MGRDGAVWAGTPTKLYCTVVSGSTKVSGSFWVPCPVLTSAPSHPPGRKGPKVSAGSSGSGPPHPACSPRPDEWTFGVTGEHSGGYSVGCSVNPGMSMDGRAVSFSPPVVCEGYPNITLCSVEREIATRLSRVEEPHVRLEVRHRRKDPPTVVLLAVDPSRWCLVRFGDDEINAILRSISPAAWPLRFSGD